MTQGLAFLPRTPGRDGTARAATRTLLPSAQAPSHGKRAEPGVGRCTEGAMGSVGSSASPPCSGQSRRCSPGPLIPNFPLSRVRGVTPSTRVAPS